MKQLKWAWALVLAALGFLLGHKISYNTKPQKAKREMEDKIENTPASDLVNAAPNADSLGQRKKQLQSNLKRELKTILERNLPHARDTDSSRTGKSN